MTPPPGLTLIPTPVRNLDREVRTAWQTQVGVDTCYNSLIETTAALCRDHIWCREQLGQDVRPPTLEGLRLAVNLEPLKSLLKYAAIFPEMEDKYQVLGLDRLEGTMMTEGQLRHRLDKIMCLFEP